MSKSPLERKREYMREYRKANKERLAVQLKAYRSTPEAKARAAERKRERRKSDPEMRKIDRQRCNEWYHRNRERVLAKERERRREDKNYYREKRIRHLYKLTLDQVAQMKAAQSDKCAICSAILIDDGVQGMHIDHCHASGRVRGLLCSSCNCGLGMFHDRADLLLAAAKYLDG